MYLVFRSGRLFYEESLSDYDNFWDLDSRIDFNIFYVLGYLYKSSGGDYGKCLIWVSDLGIHDGSMYDYMSDNNLSIIFDEVSGNYECRGSGVSGFHSNKFFSVLEYYRLND